MIVGPFGRVRETRSHLRILLIAALVALTALGAVERARASTIVTRTIDSKTLGRAWSYNVYLPTGYESSTARYPVFYLLHGNAQTYTSWVTGGHIQETADALIADGQIPATLIVMPDAGTSWYVDRKEPMESALLKELLPDVERQFRAVAERRGRAIGGLSMGGYGAMRFALKYPELFASAALLSPAIYDPEPPANSAARRVGVFGSPDYDPAIWKSLSYPALWDAYLAKQMPVPIYVVSGDDDEFLIEASATQFYELLRRNKQPAELRIVDGTHSWAVWSTTIGDAMKYVLRYVSQ